MHSLYLFSKTVIKFIGSLPTGNRSGLYKFSPIMSAYISNEVTAREFEIQTPHGHIAAKYWNESGTKTPILALHGWMDNAGTWDHLCPYLDKEYPLVAIDLEGHGLSTITTVNSGYYITSHLQIVRRVLKHFNWNKIILLGHSMGAGVSMLYAGTMPEQIEKLIMIDLVKPVTIDAVDQPGRTAKALVEYLQAEERFKTTDPPKYEYSKLIERLNKGYLGSVNEDSARTLLKRGSIKHSDGTYSFANSLFLKVSAPLSFTFDQTKAYASNVVCDILVIKSLVSPLYTRKFEAKEMFDIYSKNSRNFVLEVVDGTHHVHMNEPELVAELINRFLEGLPQSTENEIKAKEYLSKL